MSVSFRWDNTPETDVSRGPKDPPGCFLHETALFELDQGGPTPNSKLTFCTFYFTWPQDYAKWHHFCSTVLTKCKIQTRRNWNMPRHATGVHSSWNRARMLEASCIHLPECKKLLNCELYQKHPVTFVYWDNKYGEWWEWWLGQQISIVWMLCHLRHSLLTERGHAEVPRLRAGSAHELLRGYWAVNW